MTDTDESTSTGPARPSIALTTPFLVLAAAVIALAAFLLGYVVKDLGGDHRRPEFGMARFQGGPAGMERGMAGFGPGPRKGPQGKAAKVAAGTVKSVSGNTVTLQAPNRKTAKVTLGTDSFIVVRTKK